MITIIKDTKLFIFTRIAKGFTLLFHFRVQIYEGGCFKNCSTPFFFNKP